MTTITHHCGHWIGVEGRHCESTERVSLYPIGPRCPAHSPNALNGKPEPTVARVSGPLEEAMGYAERGWPVFVLGRSKRPVANCQNCRTADPATHDPARCGCLTCHGFYAATTDPDRITSMLATIPGGLLAIRTGTVSGLLIVDIDPAHGGRIDHTLMTPTMTVATGGGGWHLYYQHPGHAVRSRPMPGHPGVDIKADGGYVVAPPSIHPRTRRPYRWIGDRPINEMAPPLGAVVRSDPPPQPARETPRRSTRADSGGAISNPKALLAANLDAVANAPRGRRRTTLYGAARGIARIVATGAISADQAIDELTRVGREAEQTEGQIRAAIQGGFRDEGVTP